MALDKSNFHLSKTRSFDDKDDSKVMGVALVDGEGEHTGTATTPLNVISGDIFERIEVQLRIMNMHLAEITGETFKAEDI